jgi:hypothetical protein
VVSVHTELTFGHLRYCFGDVPPQSNSPPGNVFDVKCIEALNVTINRFSPEASTFTSRRERTPSKTEHNAMGLYDYCNDYPYVEQEYVHTISDNNP